MINFRAIDFWKPWRSMGSSVNLGTLRWTTAKIQGIPGKRFDVMNAVLQFGSWPSNDDFSLAMIESCMVHHYSHPQMKWCFLHDEDWWTGSTDFFIFSSIWDGLGGPRMFYLAHLMDKCAKLTGTPRNFSALNLNWVLDAFEIQPYLPQVTGTLFWETFACTTTIKKPGTNCIKNFQDQNNIDLWWSYRGPFFVVPRATVFLSTSSWSLY